MYNRLLFIISIPIERRWEREILWTKKIIIKDNLIKIRASMFVTTKKRAFFIYFLSVYWSFLRNKINKNISNYSRSTLNTTVYHLNKGGGELCGMIYKFDLLFCGENVKLQNLLELIKSKIIIIIIIT